VKTRHSFTESAGDAPASHAPEVSPIDADAFNQFEADGWDAKAGPYLDFWSPITARLFEPLLDAAEVGQALRLLDVGCGPGELAVSAISRGAVPIGIDIAPAMVDLACERHPDLEFRVASAEDLPFDDGSFDAVVANFVLLHLGRPEAAIAEWARVLASGRRLALSIWETPSINRLHGLILDAVDSVEGLVPVDIPEGPPAFRTDKELVALLEAVNLVDMRVDHVTFGVAFEDPAELWTGILRSGVRFPPLVNGQPLEIQGAIRSAFDRLVAVHERADGSIEVPTAIQVASGRHP
jgi:SAM-dependent methyltransferase